MIRDVEESLQIYLNSKYANRYNASTSDVDYYFSPFSIPTQYHIHLSVVSAQIPYSFYNVNIRNNTLNFYLNNQPTMISVSVPVGNYNVNTLLTALNTALSSYNFTITYSSLTNKFTFTNTSTFSFYSSSSIFAILGFYSSTSNSLLVSSLISGSYTLTSNAVVNLQTQQCVNICTNFCTNNINSVNGQQSTILASIPINCPPYSIINYSNDSTTNKVNLYSNLFASINIKLLDQDNNLIDLNYQNYSLTLQFDIVKFTDD
jgi:hypothetical protein